jgi:hypothetical protein
MMSAREVNANRRGRGRASARDARRRLLRLARPGRLCVTCAGDYVGFDSRMASVFWLGEVGGAGLLLFALVVLFRNETCEPLKFNEKLAVSVPDRLGMCAGHTYRMEFARKFSPEQISGSIGIVDTPVKHQTAGAIKILEFVRPDAQFVLRITNFEIVSRRYHGFLDSKFTAISKIVRPWIATFFSRRSCARDNFFDNCWALPEISKPHTYRAEQNVPRPIWPFIVGKLSVHFQNASGRDYVRSRYEKLRFADVVKFFSYLDKAVRGFRERDVRQPQQNSDDYEQYGTHTLNERTQRDSFGILVALTLGRICCGGLLGSCGTYLIVKRKFALIGGLLIAIGLCLGGIGPLSLLWGFPWTW